MNVSDLAREFSALLGLGASSCHGIALLQRGVLSTDPPHGGLRFGVPQYALRFFFPNLWPEAEASN